MMQAVESLPGIFHPTGITAYIDLGQIFIGSLIVAVGWFIKSTIMNFGKRLDRHDQILFNLVQDVQRLIGMQMGRGNPKDFLHDIEQ